MYELTDTGFQVNDHHLLQSINLCFEKDRVYGLIGHNGSGKSTLLKLLARQQEATAGRICLNGRAFEHWKSREFAREVAYLPQSLPTATNLTARELIAFGRYPRHGMIRRISREDRQQMDRAMALTQTEPFAERLVDSLSGGERQRVWLAMLLAQGSRFLLLDEPLAALDIAHQVETLTLVRELSHSLGLGVIIVLHDINMVARFCDHIVALRHGRLLAEGAPADMMHRATLESIYGIRMNVMAHPVDDVPVAVL